MRLTLKLFAVVALVLPFSVAPAQDLMSFLKDPKIPQRIKAADLGEDMRAMKITFEKQSGGGGDIFSMLMNPMMMMMGAFGQAAGGEEKPADPSQAAAMAFFDKLGISWTNGSTVKMFDQDFLVTYSVQINMAEAMKSKNPPDLSKSELTLTLINTKQIASITPRLDMTKAEWLKAAPVPPPAEAVLASDKNSTLSNIKQVGTAMLMYVADWDDHTPYVQSTKGAYELLIPYSKNVDIFKSLNPTSPEFRLNMNVAGVRAGEIDQPGSVPMFYEAQPWPDGSRYVVFMDGSAKMFSTDRWQEVEQGLAIRFTKVGKPLPATLGANWPKIGGG